MTDVAHLTSVHPRFDVRIFLKQCRSLANAGYQVSLVVADGLGNQELDGVYIADVGKPRGRLDRMIGAARRVLKQAIEIDADVYHLHDPELLPAALTLKRRGKRVVFDAHEDTPRQILSKSYLHPLARHSISIGTGVFERFVASRLDVVMAATPAIRNKFLAMGVNAVDINNYPLEGELEDSIAWTTKQPEICYVGGISSIRGIRELLTAMSNSRSGVRLNLAGNFSEKMFEAEVKALPGWSKVNELGFLSRTQVRDVLSRSLVGLVTLLPTPNHIESQPIKMFEYMSAGLPVIASDFPLWREIIEGNECGLCVDPFNPLAIADAIDRLVANPALAQRIGENGRRAVAERYNWGVEEKKLIALYDKLSGRV